MKIVNEIADEYKEPQAGSVIAFVYISTAVRFSTAGASLVISLIRSVCSGGLIQKFA